MADPKKFKSVFLPIKTQNFRFLGKGKLIDSNFTISKTIEVLLNQRSKKIMLQRKIKNLPDKL